MSIPVNNNKYFLNLSDKSKKVIREQFNSTNNFYKTNEYNFMLRITLAAYMDPFSAKSIMDIMNSPGVTIHFIKVFLKLNSNTIYNTKTEDGVVEIPLSIFDTFRKNLYICLIVFLETKHLQIKNLEDVENVPNELIKEFLETFDKKSKEWFTEFSRVSQDERVLNEYMEMTGIKEKPIGNTLVPDNSFQFNFEVGEIPMKYENKDMEEGEPIVDEKTTEVLTSDKNDEGNKPLIEAERIKNDLDEEEKIEMTLPTSQINPKEESREIDNIEVIEKKPRKLHKKSMNVKEKIEIFRAKERKKQKLGGLGIVSLEIQKEFFKKSNFQDKKPTEPVDIVTQGYYIVENRFNQLIQEHPEKGFLVQIKEKVINNIKGMKETEFMNAIITKGQIPGGIQILVEDMVEPILFVKRQEDGDYIVLTIKDFYLQLPKGMSLSLNRVYLKIKLK